LYFPSRMLNGTAMKAELVPANGDPPIPIIRDLTVVGRREFCDVQIDFHGLSKRHCVMVKTDGLLVIRDLGTTNGTKVNGQRIRWAALLPNDRVTMGGYKMRVYLGPDDAPSPSELASKAVSASARPPVAVAMAPARPPAPTKLGVAAPVPAPSAGQNGQKKHAPKKHATDDGFAAPSPLASPLLSREDLSDLEWASDADRVEVDTPRSRPAPAPDDDDDLIIELD
jgi:predicted component of type VI protein secretion system